MSIPFQSYKTNAAAKDHARLIAAVDRFDTARSEISAKAVNDSWYMASASGLVSFGVTAEIAKAKLEAALRNQFLSGLRVVGGAA